MKKLATHKVIFVTLFMFICTESIAGNPILPLSRPSIDQETKKKLAKEKNIYPESKPYLKKEKLKSKTDQEVVETQTIEQNEAFIYPGKKPIIIKKIVKKIFKKSSILSQRDFNLAKSAFDAIDKKKWQTAFKILKKTKNKSL